MNTPFATSHRGGMRPLAVQGVLAADCHEQLRAYLQQNRQFLAERGMPDAASFLAEPVLGANGTIDWHTNLAGRPVPLTSLPEAEQTAARANYAAAVAALQELARTGADGSLAGELLTQALQHPSDEDIYVVQGRPVLINWGYAPGIGNAAPESIMRLGDADIAAPVRPARPEPAGKPAAPAAMAAAPAAAAFAEEEKAEPAGAPSVPPTVPPIVPPAPPREEPAPDPMPEPAPQEQAEGTAAPLHAAHPHTPPQGPVRPQGGIRVVPVPVPASGCLSWLLPLLLLALLLWLLLAALGIAPSPLPTGCFHQPVSMDGERARAQSLALSEQELSRQVRERAALCVPLRPEPEAEPKEEPEKEEPVPEEPLAEAKPPVELPDFGAPVIIPEEPKEEPKPLLKAEAAPREKPKPEEKPKAETKKPAKGSTMQIPKDAAKNNDLSFLEGCWRSVTELHESLKGTPIVAEYCFEANGRGRRLVYEQDGSVCSGPATARFSGANLDISSARSRCPKGGYYVREKVQCRGSGSSTTCDGQPVDDEKGFFGKMFGGVFGKLFNKDFRWKATFVRK
ncbi:MAG: SrfA family protein [Desulfovibrionaceae bacterium]|nr:SrfA family protein [Desulfovibrionaceae bacterium]